MSNYKGVKHLIDNLPATSALYCGCIITSKVPNKVEKIDIPNVDISAQISAFERANKSKKAPH